MYTTDFAYDGPIFLVPLSLSYPSSPVPSCENGVRQEVCEKPEDLRYGPAECRHLNNDTIFTTGVTNLSSEVYVFIYVFKVRLTCVGRCSLV